MIDPRTPPGRRLKFLLVVLAALSGISLVAAVVSGFGRRQFDYSQEGLSDRLQKLASTTAAFEARNRLIDGRKRDARLGDPRDPAFIQFLAIVDDVQSLGADVSWLTLHFRFERMRAAFALTRGDDALERLYRGTVVGAYREEAKRVGLAPAEIESRIISAGS